MKRNQLKLTILTLTAICLVTTLPDVHFRVIAGGVLFRLPMESLFLMLVIAVLAVLKVKKVKKDHGNTNEQRSFSN